MPTLSTLDGLTGLRAVAASWVVAFHYCLGTFAPLGTAHASKLIDLGYPSYAGDWVTTVD